MVQAHVSVCSTGSAEAPRWGPSMSGLTELLECCQTCRTGQGYLKSALTHYQGGGRMWTHYIALYKKAGLKQRRK